MAKARKTKINQFSKTKLLIFNSILVGFLIFLVEILSYTILSRLLNPLGLVYVPDIPSSEEFNDYLNKRHPVLGWPSPESIGTGESDLLGSRKNSYFPDTNQRACVSAYGESFTFSSEVDYVNAWPNQLSKLLNCRVNNFGIGNYSTGQALLRLYENKFDSPDILILAYLSENLARNINQFRYLYMGTHPNRLGFTPRFVINPDSQELELIKLMDFSGKSYEDVYRRPEDFFKHEYFLPNTRSGIQKLRFPFTLTLIKTFASERTQNLFFSDVPYEVYYQENHPSNALKLTEKIIGDFRVEAIKRNSIPLIVLIPADGDLAKYQKKQIWSYGKLIDLLKEKNIDYINLGEGIMEYLEASGDEVCDLYQRQWWRRGGCVGHFNQKGYKLVADLVYKKIQSLDYDFTVEIK